MSRRLKLVIFAIIITVMVLLIIDSPIYITAFGNGINIWTASVLPTLLPFMILGRILMQMTSNTNSNIGTRLFKNPQGTDSIILVSLLCGYPIGAKLISIQYNNGYLSTTNSKKISVTASSCSAVFVISTVGGIFLHSITAGVIIFISHIIAMFLCGILQRGSIIDNTSEYSPNTTSTSTSNIMVDSILSVMAIGGYIAVFFVLSELLRQVLPPWFMAEGQLLTAFAIGLLEMTSGCISIASCTNLFTATVLCCSIISFGGLCVISQCMSFLSNCNIKTSTLLKQKILHCAMSTIICYVICLFINL